MRDTDYTSLRREFLGVGLTGAMVGLAGCSDSVTIETGSDDDTEEADSEGDDNTEESTNQGPDLASIELSFSYNAAEQQATVEFVGGADIKAGNVQIRQESELQVSWAELGSTTAGSDQNITPGATAVLGENILNWGQPVTEDVLIRVVYTGKDTPATLERYSPPESTDSESTVPASISEFALESSGEQQLQVSFDSSKQLGTIEVEITGAESATLARTDFTESGTGDSTFSYSASYQASSDGSYTAKITQAVDTDGTNALNGENISDAASISVEEQPSDTTPPSISAFSIANPSEQDLRVSFESNEELTSAQITISGPESTTLSLSDFSESETQGGNFSYESTYTADSDGDFTATLEQAVDENGNDGANNTSVNVTIETGSTVVDDFEDGTTSGWAPAQELNGTFEISEERSRSGSTSVRFSEGNTDDNPKWESTGDISQPDTVETAHALENGEIYSDTFTEWTADGDIILRVNYNWSNNFLAVNGSGASAGDNSGAVVADLPWPSSNNFFHVVLNDIDWDNNEVGEVQVNGTTQAENVPFFNDADGIDRTTVSFGGNGGNVVFLDDTTIPQ